MEFKRIIKDHTLYYVLEGELNSLTAPSLEKDVQEASKDINEIVYDFAKLTYISSAGLRILLISKKLLKPDEKVIVKNPCADIVELFEMTGFIDIVEIQ